MTMKVRALLGLMLGLTTMWLTGCGHYTCGATFGSSSCSTNGGGLSSGNPGSGGMAFAYLLAESHTSAPTMAADELDLSTNTFRDLGTTFVSPTFTATIGAIDGGTVVVNLTSQRYLYVPFDDGTVFGYAIDGTTGALTAVPGIPFSAAGGTSITADPAGRFLFVSDAGGGQITAFTINATNGSLTSAGSVSTGIVFPVQMSTDGKGKFLYAAEGPGGTRVASFSINQSTGALTSLGAPIVFSGGMAQLEGEKSGQFMLGISGADSHIHVLAINATTGAIAEVSGSPFVTIAVPLSIVVHPTGTFVYSVAGAGTAMEGYSINATSGALTAVTGSPFTTVRVDQGQFDQSGDFLFGQAIGNVGADFGPYPTDPTTGLISAPTFPLLGFPGGGFAVSDLNSAP
jgi:6-phosphogluconolactonase